MQLSPLPSHVSSVYYTYISFDSTISYRYLSHLLFKDRSFKGWQNMPLFQLWAIWHDYFELTTNWKWAGARKALRPLFFLKAGDETPMWAALPLHQEEKTFLSPGMEVNSKRSLCKQSWLNNNHLPLVSLYILVTFLHCHLFNLVYKHLGFATSLGFHFPMGFLSHVHVNIYMLFSY